MNFAVLWKLSLMMMLQYWIWGAWGSYLPVYLDDLQYTPDQAALILSMLYVASLIAPFIGGQIADRYLATERFLGIAHILGGVFIFVMAEFISFYGMLLFMFLHSLMYATTLPLTNSISFQNLSNVEKDFGKIRVWGTLGWIFAGWALTFWLKISPDGANCLRLAGVAAVVLGVFSFWLPHTPPQKEGANPLAFLEAIKLLKIPSFLIFMIVAFVVATELQFYYFLTGPFLVDLGIESSNVPLIMTLAQGAEIITLVFLLPIILPRLGIKASIMIGIAAWPVRYIIFAIGEPTWLVIASLTLHGFCYVFFFVVGQIYVDRIAPKDIRGSAQSFLAIVTFGLGLTAGSLFAGRIRAIFTETVDGAAVTDWFWVFLVPVALTVLCAIFFAVFFHDPNDRRRREAEAVAEA